MVGKGSLTHNSRAFKAENIKADFTRNNIEYCNENIKEVYHELFDEALERYNAKQKRSDRVIDNYYEKIRTCRQEKLFHEVILQIGNKDDMNVQSENGELSKSILDDFMREFQSRNPNLRVFSAHLHMNEETPHLHIDFVPFTTGSKRGMDTRVSLKQALADQGYLGGTKRETEWSQWMVAEKQELSKVMELQGVIWKQLGTRKKHLSVLDFKKQEREKEVQTLTKQKEEISQDIQTIKEAVTDGKEDLKELQDKKKYLQQEILKLTSDRKTTEKNIVTIRENSAWQLPEPGTLMTAKFYRDKKVVPLLEMVKEALVSALVKNVQLNGLVEKFKRQYEYSRKQVERLEQRLTLVEKENVDFRGEILDFDRVKAVLGDREVKSIVEQKKSVEMLNMINKPQRKKEVDR